MSLFLYKGRGPGGKAVNGSMQGASVDAVAQHLLQNGVTPVEIVPGSDSGGGQLQELLRKAGERKPSLADLIMLTRQLYTLTKAGIPLANAIRGLADSSANARVSAALRDIGESLESGLGLSQAMSRHGAIFPPIYISLVRVGEDTGRLEEVFLQLAGHLELERGTRERIKSALRYPVIVLATIGIAIMLINIFVIPAFTKIFEGFDAELPVMTRVLIAFSDFTINYWPVLIGMLAGAIYGFRAWLSTESGRVQWDRLKLVIPAVGGIIRRATLARTCRSFALVLRSGVPFIQGLNLVSRASGNEYVSGKLTAMRAGVERGDSLTRTAAASGLFTPLVMQMITIGEETGRLDELLQEVAEFYEREVDAELKTLSSVIEPVMIIAIGALVLVLALGVFLPMWDLGTVARGG